MNKKFELFKKVCYAKGKEQFDLLYHPTEKGYIRRQGTEKFNPSDTCRFCFKKIDEKDFEVSYSYWNAFLNACHKSCKNQGEKGETEACQDVDKDCNFCKHFLREVIVKDANLQDKEKRGIFPALEGWQGKCEKFKKTVFGYSDFCSGKDCFVSRV